MPNVTGILETALYVEDVARSSAFYERVLGFRRILEEGDRLHALAVGDAPQVLLLFRKGGTVRPVATEGGVIPPHDGDGNLHLAFAIPADSREEWERRLAENGVEIESVVYPPRGGVSLYFRDPDGHVVELATPGLWEVY